jgi:hypothetical protein
LQNGKSPSLDGGSRRTLCIAETFPPLLGLLSLGDERDAESEEGNQAVEGKRLDAGSRASIRSR